MRILVLEDDKKTAAFVVKGLTEAGHVCDQLADGRDALFQATREAYDVFVVDRMTPGLDGLSVVKSLRVAGVMTPVIFLTSVGGVDDRVEGLEAGADDYLVKPFAFSELMARLNALGRRPPVQEQKTLLKVADLEMDLIKRQVVRQGQSIELQPREFRLLEVLMRSEGRVITRTMLLERVWDFHFDPKTSVVETHVSRLRAKIDRPFAVPLLHTVRNTGYSLFMRRVENLLRSTPFRLALSFAGLVILAFLLSGGIVYQTMSANLNRRLDEAVRQTYSTIAATYGESDVEDLITAVNAHAGRNSGNDQLISLTGAQGESLAGNLSAVDLPTGFSTVPEGTPGFPDTAPYRAYSARVGSTNLTVAQSYSETEELEHLLLASFAWAAVIVAGLAVAGGAFLASRVQRRLDVIGETMVAVSQGKLEARIPQLGRDDDIDAVSNRINAALDQLSSLVEGMKQVSSDIAHDLKTPLNRLHMILDGAAEKAGLREDVSADLAEARAESSQINETFDALLRIAQIEAGARKARFVRLDLAEIVASIAEIYADVAEDDGKMLVLTGTDSTGWVTGDRELLTQLFANLVENAIRHTPPGTRIEVSLSGQAGGKLAATVVDDGPGIPPHEHDKVFQRLYRLDKSRSTPGTGVGLSLVKAIADLHGASVSMQERNPGLAAVVTFPG